MRSTPPAQSPGPQADHYRHRRAGVTELVRQRHPRAHPPSPLRGSTLLTAIDKDTGSAYLYAVSHANGTSTVIKALGKVPGTYKDPVFYLNTTEGHSPLFGE